MGFCFGFYGVIELILSTLLEILKNTRQLVCPIIRYGDISLRHEQCTVISRYVTNSVLLSRRRNKELCKNQCMTTMIDNALGYIQYLPVSMNNIYRRYKVYSRNNLLVSRMHISCYIQIKYFSSPKKCNLLLMSYLCI